MRAGVAACDCKMQRRGRILWGGLVIQHASEIQRLLKAGNRVFVALCGQVRETLAVEDLEEMRERQAKRGRAKKKKKKRKSSAATKGTT